MNDVITLAVYFTGFLAIIVACLWSVLWLIGRLWKLFGNYGILIEAIYHVGRKRYERKTLERKANKS